MNQPPIPSVWLVDDDEDDRFFIRAAFREINPSIQIVTLNDGDQLLPHLSACASLPHLILVDANMPRKNGFEVLQELGDTPRFTQIQIVMLTTSSAEEDRQRALALGAKSFFIKPPSFDLLRQLIRLLCYRWLLI